MMKKNILSLILVSTLSALSITNANSAQVTASADAQWQAKATKDSKSQLVVVPMDALSFNYAAAIKGFNTQNGRFSVDIISDIAGAKDFTLSATTTDADNLLTRSDGTTSTLTVGARWNNKELGSDKTYLIKAEGYDLSNPLKTLFDKDDTGRSSASGNFTFFIKKANDGSTIKNFSDLSDGEWSGNATVKFTVAWTQ